MALVIDKARSLPANAKFSDLVRIAREASTTSTSGNCLFQGGKSGEAAVLAAPLDKPAAKLVDPPADLDALLTSGKTKKPFSDFGTRILTPAGHSEGGDYLDLVTFTPASRLATGQVVPILIATDQGIYMGLPNTVSDGKTLKGADIQQLKNEILPKAQIWVITAEGDAPISRVREALSLIRETTGITRYEPLHDRVENRSLAIETVEREAGRPVPRLHLADADGPGSAGFHRDRPDELRVYRPPVSDAKPRYEPVAAPSQGRAPTPELKGRQVLEQRELDARQARDKQALEEEIRRGATHPPAGIPPADAKRRDDLRRQAFEQQAKREKQQLDAWHRHEDAPDPRRTTSPAPKYVAPPVRNVPRPDVNAPPRGDAKPGHAPAEKVPPRTDADGTRPPARKPGDC